MPRMIGFGLAHRLRPEVFVVGHGTGRGQVLDGLADQAERGSKFG